MKTNGKIWIIYDSVKKQQTQPLPTLQAQVVLLKLQTKAPNRYFLWTPGWDDWMSIEDFLISDEKTFVLAPAAPPKSSFDEEKTEMMSPINDEVTDIVNDEASDVFTQIIDADPGGPLKKIDYGYYFGDFSADKLDPEAKPTVEIKLARAKRGAERRASRRLTVRLEVILINKNGRTFRSDSIDISKGGTMLRDELPQEFVNCRFDMILVNKFEKDPSKGRVHMQCRVVGDYKNPRRLMFLDPDSGTLRRLEAMLKSYAEHQKARKKTG